MARRPMAGNSGKPHDDSCCLPLCKGADDESDSGGAASVAEWKLYYRTKAPEEMEVKLGNVLSLWKRHQHFDITFAHRRQSLAERFRRSMRTRKASAEKAHSTVDICRELRQASSGSH